MVTSIYDIDPDPGNTHTQGDAFPQLTAYKYDQLHRLRHMKAFRDITLSTNSWNAIGGSPNQSYKTDLVYDRNGNILSHQRKGASFVTAGLNMDNLTYGIDDAGTVPTNRLINVGEAQSSTYSTDIKATYSGATGNDYDYDKIGNLRKDNKEFISAIEWTVDRKVKRVTRDITNMIAQGKNLPDLEFEYDANRQRICKIVKPHDALGNLKDQTDWVYTYYQRDASGNITATYAKTYAFVSGHTYSETLVLNEHDIYGSARLGVYNEGVAMGTKTFTANISGGVFAGVYYPATGTAIIPCEVSYTDASSGNPITINCAASYTRTLGDKRYELTNHLGNVITVISDRKLQNAGDGTSTVYERIFDDNDLTGVYFDPNIPATGGIVGNAIQVNPQGAYSGVAFNFATTPGQTYQAEFDLDQGTVDASDNFQVWVYEPSLGWINNYVMGAVQSGHYTFTFPGYTGVSDMWVKVMFLNGNNTPANTSTVHFNHYFSVDNFRVTTPNTSVQVAESYNAEILETHDYYAFGYDMPGRSVKPTDGYKFSFNGKLDDKQDGWQTQDYGFRGYDYRLGKFFSEDPLTGFYSYLSPYSFAANRCIEGIDLEGGEFLRKSAITFVYSPVLAITTQQQSIANGNIGIFHGGNLFLKYRALSTLLSATGNDPTGYNTGDSQPKAWVITKMGAVVTEYSTQYNKKTGQRTIITNKGKGVYIPTTYESIKPAESLSNGIVEIVAQQQRQLATAAAWDYYYLNQIDKAAFYKAAELVNNAIDLGLVPPEYSQGKSLTELYNAVLSDDFKNSIAQNNGDLYIKHLAEYIYNNMGMINRGLDPSKDHNIIDRVKNPFSKFGFDFVNIKYKAKPAPEKPTTHHSVRLLD